MKLLIATLLLSASFFSQPSFANFRLYVTLNMSECTACYNSLRHLENIDSRISLHYILPEDYRGDSAEIAANFKFPARGSYYWSDSMFSRYAYPNGLSSVTLVNENSQAIIRYALKQEFDSKATAFYNSLVNEQMELPLSAPLLSMNNGTLTYNGNELCFVNQMKNCFTKVDLKTGQEILLIKMSDTLSKAAFRSKFDNDQEWIRHRKIINDLKLPRFQLLKEQQLTPDYIYLTGVYTYFIISANKQDTGEARFEAIHQFDRNGKLLHTGVVKDKVSEFEPLVLDVLNGKGKDTVFYFSNTSPFWVENDSTVLMGVRGFASKDYPYASYFLGRYVRRGKDPNYEFKNYVNYVLPPAYKQLSYNFCNARFTEDGKFFMLPLSDELYTISEKAKPLELGLFTNKTVPANPFELENEIVMVRHDKQNFYVLFYEKMALKYAKINMSTKTKTISDISAKIEKYKLKGYATPDFFDYNYIVVPTESDKLLRFKVF